MVKILVMLNILFSQNPFPNFSLEITHIVQYNSHQSCISVKSIKQIPHATNFVGTVKSKGLNTISVAWER